MNEETVLHRLAALDPGGWQSVVQLTFTLEPDSSIERQFVRRAIYSLVASGYLEHLYCLHRDEPMLIVNLDSVAL